MIAIIFTFLSVPLVTLARDVTLLLESDHVSYRWRREAGHKLIGGADPDEWERVVVWTRHEQVGIGNALGGFGRVMVEAMTNDRELVIHSLIFDKFCEIVSCTLTRQPEDWCALQLLFDSFDRTNSHSCIHSPTPSPLHRLPRA